MSKRLPKILTVLACVAFIVLAFLSPQDFINNSKNGIRLFAFNVLPILFPFFFITGLLVELDLFKHKKLQHIGIISMSFLAGSPTSARILSQLYLRGDITREQAIKTATYTSTTSPIFIIATLGASLYQDIQLGIIIFIAHISGAVINGLFFGFVAKTSPAAEIPKPQYKIPTTEPSVSDAITKSLHSAIQNILAVGGLIVIFFIASTQLPLPVAAILEMTTGAFRAEAVTDGIWRVIIACSIVTFGGMCVAMQSFVFLRTFRMPVRFYFLYKATHTFFAVTILLLLLLLPI